MIFHFSRRSLLLSSVVATMTQLGAKASAKETHKTAHKRLSDVEPELIDHVYEVTFTKEEWKARLSEEEFRILREGGTEKKKSSPLWKEKRAGHYYCKGCDLGVYASEHKVVLSKGWAFFQHSEPDSVLTGIDLYTSYGSSKPKTSIEAHCRRCEGHFGSHTLCQKQDSALHQWRFAGI